MTRASSSLAHIGRYLGVGGLCAIAHNVIMIGGGLFHWFYAFSFALSYLVVTLLGYFLHVLYTFGVAMTWRGLWRFAAANAVGAQISFGLTALFISGFGFSVVVAAPVVTLILFFWNFAATHWALGVPRPARF
ncbi:GtrA family protein [Rhodoblastus sp.]|uniref:GtrA family protein n=1 Tax=Rhodoblastus sp. TaxID=1962975 RepID=UPI003F956F5D